jgi:hypothetical protein
MGIKNTTIKISIGKIVVAIACSDLRLIRALTKKYKNFLSANHPSYTVRVSLNSRLSSTRGITATEKKGACLINGGEFRGRFTWRLRQAKIELRPHASVVDSFLRVFYSLILNRHQGFLIHAAGLSTQEKGYLFAGPSSSGKTTVARRADPFLVLNDELALIRIYKNTSRVFATPFRGEYRGPISNSSVKLAALCFLDKQQKDTCRPLARTDTLIQLMENIFCFTDQPKETADLLTLCSRLVTHVPGYTVNTKRGRDIQKIVRKLMLDTRTPTRQGTGIPEHTSTRTQEHWWTI